MNIHEAIEVIDWMIDRLAEDGLYLRDSEIQALNVLMEVATANRDEVKAILKEIIKDNETGLYFKKGNIESYAETLEKLIKDKDLRDRLGRNARKWVEANRQWSNNAQSIKKEIFNAE